MQDLIYIVISVLFFAVCALYVRIASTQPPSDRPVPESR
jgi:hypothetical protein